ncbi:hypothetical protein CJF42_16745 [Pseudoalteromonas sp. NBT06-2]|uniref:hypothetical protein n=1 Tax=Pseudoalteromonas sp. NBT06-2 TaxID=2025950 RepID=UPI000BA79244|nr:hypothetical protein [Pseudoalteromonas sp. NBT06-2]PAJ73234.1 hypothetical protein CJF42_16745 [Pseudoalteromonas sp. NBT06-2]
MAISWHYNRPELAKNITQQLTSGLFNRLAYLGQRRIGKTMFLLKDLTPSLVKANCIPVYISMWSNKNAPQKEMINKLQMALKQLGKKNALQSVLKAEITKVKALGITAEFGKLDPVVATDDELVILGNLLRQIVKEAENNRVILLFDEIQHLITAKEFTPLQYMLRTILDELNESIGVLYTGSSRRGIEAMFNNKDMPFYSSANQVAFPHLSDDYVSHINAMLKKHFDLNFSTSELIKYFNAINQSAFWFDRLVQHLALNQTSLREACKSINEMMQLENQYDPTVDALTKIQQGVLIRVADKLSRYDEEAMTLYKKLGVKTPNRSQIQSAYKSLENKRLITKVANTIYIEESGIVRFIKEKYHL